MVWVENKEVMARNISYYLLKKGKTRKEACAEMGIGYSTFTEWLNARKYPRIDKIELMADYFGVQKSDLIENKLSDISAAASTNTPEDYKRREQLKEEWNKMFGDAGFSDEEFIEIANYARYVISKRNNL